MNLIQKLKHHGYKYALLVAELSKTLEYHDMGYKVVFGDPGDPQTYERLRVRRAAMVVVTNDDMMNTKIAFTIREVCKDVPIITNADEDHSLDILQFAGATHVFQFMKMLGMALARRTLGLGAGTNVIGRFDQLLIVEAPAMHTPLEGKTLAAIRLREQTGISVVGVWARGAFIIPTAHTVIDSTMVLVMAGTATQLKRYEEKYCLFHTDKSVDAPVLILGGGRVGLAAAKALEEQGVDYRIVEKDSKIVRDAKCVYGNAADIETLRRAGINEARSVLITTHEDAINLYLTIYCRQLRPDMQIISRANRDRTISRLHSAGADLVMSSASMGANTIINLLKPGKVLTVAEGLNVFKSPLPDSLVGKNLGQSQVREKTSCSVIAIRANGEFILNPASSRVFASDDELILIGTFEAEKRFMETY